MRDLYYRIYRMQEHDKLDRLTSMFNTLFSAYNTRLIRGDGEPIYSPCDETTPYNRVVFAHGFFASALHEIAHWCIAGESRRKREDYGYWYCPDGRNSAEQAEFEAVEIKPQALEWAFSIASAHSFRVSTDNLEGAEPNRTEFSQKVKIQLLAYMDMGFPKRAQQFIDALHTEFQTEPLCAQAIMESSI